MDHPTPLDIPTLKALPKLLLQYRKPSNKKALIQWLTSFWPFLGIIILMYLIGIYDWLPLWTLIPLGIINGFFLVRIFIIQHDCGHQSFTASQWINNAIGQIASMFSLIPYRYWAKSHNFHHNHANKLWEYRDIGEIMTYSVEEFKQLSPFKQRKYKIFRNPFIMFILWPIWYVGVTCRLPFVSLQWRGKEKLSLITSNLLMTGLYLSLWLLVWWQIFLIANGSIIFAFAIIAIRFFYIQHQYEFWHKEFADKRDYVRAAIQGSSFYDLPRFWHWMTGNIGYHHIHHLNPSIPCYELARCFHDNKLLQDVARRLTFTKSLESLRCHLRDEHQNKMISFREFKTIYMK